MTARTTDVEKQEPKRLTPWAPFDWHTKLKAWLQEHKRSERLDWDAERGRFVHTVKSGPGAWAESGAYASQKEFALAQGIIEPRDG